MSGETKSEIGRSVPTKLLLVDSGSGSVQYGLEIAKMLATTNYNVKLISPREAKELRLEPDDNIRKIRNIIPETFQLYPHSQVEPNRRQRRLNKRKK